MGKSKGKRADLVGKTSASSTAVIKSPSPASDPILIKTDSSLSGNADGKGLLALQKPVDPHITTSCGTESSDRLNRKPGLSPQAFDVNWDCKNHLELEKAIFHLPHPNLVGSLSTSSTTRKAAKSLPTSSSSPRASASPPIWSSSSPSESSANYARSTSFQSSTPSVSPTTAQRTHSPIGSQASSSPESTRVSPEPRRGKETMAETCSGSGITIKKELESQTEVKQYGTNNPLKPEMGNCKIGNSLKEQMSEWGSGQRNRETLHRRMMLRYTRAPERIETLVNRLEDKIGPFPLTLYTGIIEYYYLRFRDHMEMGLHLTEGEIEEYVASRKKMMNEKKAKHWERVLRKHYADEIEQHGIRHLCETYLWELAHINPDGLPPAPFYEKELTPKLVEEAVEALCEPLMEFCPADNARKAILLRAMADAERFGIYDQSPAVSQSSATVQSTSAPSVSPTTAQRTKSPTKAPLLPSISEPSRVKEIMAETCSGSGITIKKELESQTEVKQYGTNNPLKPEMGNCKIGNSLKEQMSEWGSGQRNRETLHRRMMLRYTRAPERIETLVNRLEDKIGPFPLTLYTGIIEYYYLRFRDHMEMGLHLTKGEIEEYVASRKKMMNEKKAKHWERVLRKHYADEIEQHGIRHLCETYLWKLAHVNPDGLPPAPFYEKELTPKLVEEAVEALCEPLMEFCPADNAQKAILLRAMADAERFGIYDQ